MSTKTQVIQKKLITSDTLNELAQEVNSYGNAKNKTIISQLSNGKYFASLEVEGSETPTHEITLQSKTITENGTYTADSGYDGFSSVEVNVPDVIREVEKIVEVPVELPHSSELIYNGTKITIQVVKDNPEASDTVVVELHAISGSVDWGDGHTSTVNEENKVYSLLSDDSITYAKLTHSYDIGTYTLYFSDDFSLVNSPDLDAYGWIFDIGEPSDKKTRDSHNAIWDRCVLKSVGGTCVKDLDFTYIDVVDGFTLEEGIKVIESVAFARMEHTCVDFIMPSSLSIIENFAFYNNFMISGITLSKSLHYIGYSAFQGCYYLSTINIPENSKLFFIGGAAFEDCSIRTLDLSNADPYLRIGEYAFSGCPIENLIVPQNNHFLIKSFAFKDCPIENFVDPPHDHLFDNYSFNGVKHLKIMSSELGVYKSNYKAYLSEDGQSSLESIHVPYSEDHSVLNAYKTAEGWSQFADIIFESDPE